MIPIPTSRVFRSRRGALVWSFWVIVAGVAAAGFADPPATAGKVVAHAADVLVAPVDDQNLKVLLKTMNAS